MSAHKKFREECRESVRLIRETGRRCVQDRINAKKRGEKIPNDILAYILQQSNDLQDGIVIPEITELHAEI